MNVICLIGGACLIGDACLICDVYSRWCLFDVCYMFKGDTCFIGAICLIDGPVR